MRTAGIVILFVSLITITATFYMKWSSEKRFDERTANISQIKQRQLESTGTSTTGTNFYLQPDPERKLFWATAWNFGLPTGVALFAGGALLVWRSASSTSSEPVETNTSDR